MDKEQKDRLDQAEAISPIDQNPIDRIGDTVRIRRPPRVFTTVLGQNIWMGDVEPCELELEQKSSTDPYDSATVEGPWGRIKP